MGALLKTVAMAVAACAVLWGCGGGGARTYNQTKTTTLGEELLDLQKAYEAGAISEQEYEKQRNKLLEQ